jgi:hypothetical protein
MTTSNPLPDSNKWQELYSASDSRWKDLDRMGIFFMPIIFLVTITVAYVYVGYARFYSESLAPQNSGFLSITFYVLSIMLIIFAPLMMVLLGLFFILKQSTSFMRSFYQPAQNEKLGGLIQRRLLGVLPVPPPLDIIFKYPPVVVRKPSSLDETHWARWLGGPATLIIFDGLALYLERGNQFSRVVGPGLPMAFLEQHERVKEIVDLRPQTKTGVIRPWTKDGIRLHLTIRAICQVNASPDAKAHSSKFRYPFDPEAVKMAVERTTVKVDAKGQLYESSWLDGAWGTVTGMINAYVASHSLDHLFFLPPTNNGANGEQTGSSEPRDIATILSQRIREELRNTERGLAQNGVKVLAVQIIDVKLPTEVQRLRGKYWLSEKERAAAIGNSRAEADRIRIREQAHADAQRTMLNAITQRLEKIDPKNLTEPLILSLSGLIDQGLDDPIVRPLIAKESFGVLERVRKLLQDGF